MTRKQIVTSELRAFVTPANIQHVRTGARRRTARKAVAVVAVRPLFAERGAS
jgi:hypothetical protein